MDEVEFSIDETLDFIVGALEYKLGARGLRSCEGGLNRCV
jgi:hypothetical protein